VTTNFPSSIDAFTNPTSADTLDNPPHDQQHADINDAMEAVQAKVGVDGSAVTSSLDYKVAQQGLTFIKSVTIGSGVSSVTVSDAFSADFQNYKILIDVADCTDDSAFHFQIGAATAGYYGGHYAYRFNGATYNNFSNNGAYTSIGAAGSGYGGWYVIDISNPYATQETSWNGNFLYRRTSDSGNGAFGFHGGMVDNTTSYTSFSVEPNGTNTISGGTIRVYGYNNG